MISADLVQVWSKKSLGFVDSLCGHVKEFQAISHDFLVCCSGGNGS